MVRKYKLNEDFFYKETPELAYFLGYFMSDGYICCGQNNKYRITFNLSETDEVILKTFRDWICPDIKLYYHKTKQKSGYISNMCRLFFDSQEIVTYLKDRYKINLNKTFNPVIPYNINKDLISHFIRGEFDGDGSISLVSNNRPQVIISSASKFFLEEIISILGYGNIKKNTNIYDLSITKSDNVIKFRDFIYNNDCLSLDRKKRKFYESNNSLKFTNLNQNELKFIQENYDKLPLSDICTTLGRNYETVRVITKNLGRAINKRYSQDDKNKITDMYLSGIKIKDIALNMNRTVKAINHQVIYLGLK